MPVTMLLPLGAEGMPHNYHAHAHGNYLIHAYFGGYVSPLVGYRSKERMDIPSPQS